jgi:hypothetical protein
MAESLILWLADEADGPNERHRYVARIVFDVILKCDYQWAANEAEWLGSSRRKIQYGGAAPKDKTQVSWIPSAGLLVESGTSVPSWIWSDASNEATPGGTRLPFGVRIESEGKARVFSDWWSWLFWMTTRLEEYKFGKDERDVFGRINGRSTLAFQEKWLARPEVEFRVIEWANSCGFSHQLTDYCLIPTVDVDSAFAYRHRSFFMTVAATIQDILKGRWRRIMSRINVLRGAEPDAYDTYDWLEQLHQKMGLRAIYFFLLANRGKYDRGLSWRSPGLQNQIQSLQNTADIGIHPGFAAHESLSSDEMKAENARLMKITGLPVIRSRQHYLLQQPGASWRRLEGLGVKEDHSLGYADVIGFRGGMSRAFPAYDVINEKTLCLELHPVAAMDATLMRYLRVTPEEAVDQVVTLADATKEVGGVFRLLWHNESVSDIGEWKGWQVAYEEMLKRVR